MVVAWTQPSSNPPTSSCSRANGEPISQLIQIFQTARGYDAEFARFVHGALYLGEDRICHARVDLAPIQRGIRIESIFAYNPYSFLPMAALRVPDIPDADRVRVALAAACKTGLRYDFTGALDLCRGFLNLRFPRTFYEPDQRSEILNAHICSDLIENAYDEVWPGKDVLGTSDGTALLTLPADIAKSTKLLPVEIPVCRID